jgi:hypothetical protein
MGLENQCRLMGRTTASLAIAICAFVSSNAGAGEISNLVPTQDTHVLSNAGDSNLGTTTSATEVLFLQYDVSAIPSVSTIDSATLSSQKAFTDHLGDLAISSHTKESADNPIRLTVDYTPTVAIFPDGFETGNFHDWSWVDGASQSCSGACGNLGAGGCWCDSDCIDMDDCCPDVCPICGIC